MSRYTYDVTRRMAINSRLEAVQRGAQQKPMAVKQSLWKFESLVLSNYSIVYTGLRMSIPMGYGYVCVHSNYTHELPSVNDIPLMRVLN